MTDTREEYDIPDCLRNQISVQFEKWAEDYALGDEPIGTEADRLLDCKAAHKAGYQACEAHYKERIAELESGFSPSLTVAMQTIKKQNERIAELEKDANKKVFIGVDLGGDDKTTISFFQGRSLTNVYEGDKATKILLAIDQAIADSKE